MIGLKTYLVEGLLARELFEDGDYRELYISVNIHGNPLNMPC